jgi:uncharacterized protein YndB with AHSA1/START domain
MNINPLVIEQTYYARVSSVWKAITDKNQMKQWYFNFADFKAEVGFEFTFTGGTEERSYLHLCKVTNVEAEKKLTHSWRYEGYEGETFVTWQLFAESDKTRLILTHEGLETLPQNNKDFAKENFAAGWTQILGVSLKDFVEK